MLGRVLFRVKKRKIVRTTENSHLDPVNIDDSKPKGLVYILLL